MIPEEWTPAEPEEIIAIFSDMLRLATGDGAVKRRAGTKVSWRVDPGHEDAMYRHLKRWEEGEEFDKDSKAHPLIHVAWRALAVAYRQTHG